MKSESYVDAIKEFLAKPFMDESGEMNAGSIVGVVIALAIGIIVVASIMPTAMDQLYAANTSDWTVDGAEDTKTTALWELLPMFAVLSILLVIIAVALKYV